VDRITRKELKQDKFAQEVGQTVEFLGEHRRQAIQYGAAGLIVVLAVVGFFVWRARQSTARATALTAALDIWHAPVVPRQQADPNTRTFATQQDKEKAAIPAFSEVAAKYPGSDEGVIAQYYLGAIAADEGNLSAAETALKEVIDSGDANYASLAKLALADVYKAEHRQAEGEKLIRSIISKPSVFVSKDEATLALARYIASTNPEEARKLLLPLRASRPVISRAALTELGSLPAK
jgi:predicted negative regulator of RcsB-dependent stress response